MESEHEESSSDEEYVPPAKLAKKDGSDASTDSDDSSGCDDSNASDESVSEDRIAKPRRGSRQRKTEIKEKPKLSESEEDGATKKAKEDAIWNEFLTEVDRAKPSVAQPGVTEVVRKYRFAGEEIQVTERLNPKTVESKASCSINGSSTSIPSTTLVPARPRYPISSSANPTASQSASNTKSNLSTALQNLRSLTSAKPPKISTLEKSRLDWQNFVRKEDLEDDLKAHNKGKEGYLERQAFVDRATEREFAYQKAQMKRKL